MVNLRMKMLVVVVVAMGCFMVGTVRGMTHIVGGSNGWTVPETKNFFEEWAKPRTFGVGDRLVFPYRPGANNLVVVNKQDYESCTQDEVINMYFLGPTIINLTSPGDYYYYCGIGKHCEAGQKLHITVVQGEGSSGNALPFKLDDIGFQVNVDSAAPTPSTTVNATGEAAKSSASSVEKLGVVSGFLALVVSVFI